MADADPCPNAAIPKEVYLQLLQPCEFTSDYTLTSLYPFVGPFLQAAKPSPLQSLQDSLAELQNRVDQKANALDLSLAKHLPAQREKLHELVSLLSEKNGLVQSTVASITEGLFENQILLIAYVLGLSLVLIAVLFYYR